MKMFHVACIVTRVRNTTGHRIADAGLESRIDHAVVALDLPQKVRLLTGSGFWRTHAEPAIGLRAMVLSDGPTGVRGERYDERDPSLCLPCATALGATWDDELVRAAGLVLAGESRRKGVDVLLGPTVNLQRSPYGGRHFECYAEDPLLSGRIGAALVTGIQDGGVAATVKHYAANDSETDRFTVDVRMDERTLHEVALAPFEHIVTAARPWALMAAYNKVGGTTMTENALLTDPLRTAWGFDGLVVSDWLATRSTAASARSGLDLAMPGPVSPWGAALIAAVTDGQVEESAIDAKVRNLLRLASRVGAWHSDPTSAPPIDGALLRRAAAAGAVLLTNPAGVLPLDAAALRSVAVLGPNADTARIQGGGSATVIPAAPISPLAGLTAALGPDVEITHGTGVRITDRLRPITDAIALDPQTGAPGLHLRFSDAAGTVVHEELRYSGRLLWFGEPVAASATVVEASTVLHVETSGEHEIGVAGVGPFRIAVDGAVVLDVDIPPAVGVGSGILNPPERRVRVPLAAGDRVVVTLRHSFAPDPLFMGFLFGLEIPHPAPAAELAAAVALAAAADVAIVVVGTDAETESEGVDRTTLALPGEQDELVCRVAAVNPRTIVVVNAGAPVLLPWRDDVAAVLATWFPGEQGGAAIADVLLGRVEPGGRLPMTWPAADTDGPLLSTTPVDGVLDYAEGVHIGHRGWARAGVAPAYPFGHGLGYTTWELSDPVAIAGDPARVAVTARNTGTRPGRQVVQAYLSRPYSTVERPVFWLAGYAAVTAEPGVAATVEIRIERRAFEHWAGGWELEPGEFTVRLAVSAADPGVTTTIRR